jgi:glycosyltransferase involved in cell wall biosynthesis
LIQRKGLSYLLDAARMLGSSGVRFVLCGRGRVDEQLLAPYSDVNLEVKIGLSTPQLVEEIRRSDVFVLPSLAEGFSHAILESMSCGVPVITTNHTCAPDVMTDKVHGFIVPIRNSEAIAERLEWGIGRRAELAGMGQAAATRAQSFTWERFRSGVREAYGKMVAEAS